MLRRYVKRLVALVLCLIVMATGTSCCSSHDSSDRPSDTLGGTTGDSQTEAGASIPSEELQRAYAQGYSDGFDAGMQASEANPDAGKTDAPDGPAESDPPADPDGFVVVTDVIPDAILEIRYFSTYNFVGERIPGYVQPVALLTAEAADALKAASDAFLQQGYRIKIYDAYRPQTAVDFFKAWAADLDDVRMKDYFYPELAKSALFDLGYVAEKSGHSRGSTVDLTLVDMHTGQEVDMGGPFDFFGELSHFTYTATLTDAQIENRTILHDTMVANGFRALETEWWHFTLVDEPYPDTYFDFPVQDLEALAA